MNNIIQESNFKTQTDLTNSTQSNLKIKKLSKTNKELQIKINKSKNQILNCLENFEKIKISDKNMKNYSIKNYFKSFLINLKQNLKTLDLSKEILICDTFEIQNSYFYSNSRSKNIFSNVLTDENEELKYCKSIHKESNILFKDNDKISFESMMKDFDKCKRENRKDNLRYFRNVQKMNNQNFLKSKNTKNFKKYKKWEEQLLSKNI